MRFRALIVCTALLATWHDARACSFASPIDPLDDSFVFYADVVSFVDAPFAGGTTSGIRVVPRYEIRMPERTAEGSYEIYPLGLAADCRATAITLPDPLRDWLAPGAIVGVLGSVPARTSTPGDIQIAQSTGLLFPVERGCDVVALAQRAYDYSGGERKCVVERFEVNKDIARLETAAPGERFAILERLASYRGPLRYAGLIAAHVADRTLGQRLWALRYGGVAALGCAVDRAELNALDWATRLRHSEYCGQPDPYDAAAQEDRALYDAIADRRLDVVEQFLGRGRDANAPLRGTPMAWVHPLKVAVHARSEEIALALLRAGADFERSGVAPYVVSDAGMARVWEFLLAQRSDRIDDALGSVSSACRHGYLDVVHAILDHARAPEIARLDSEVLGGCLPHSPEAARLLIDRGVPITSFALYRAARFGSVGIVRFLLERGADPSERYPFSSGLDDIAGFAAIDFALEEYEFKDEEARERVHYILHELSGGPPPVSGEHVASLARDSRAMLDSLDTQVDWLRFAGRMGLYEDIEARLAGSEIIGDAALMAGLDAALAAGNTDVARLLLARGAPPDGGALHRAAQTSPAGMVRHLIALGAPLDEQVDGLSPFEALSVSRSGDFDVLSELLLAGADACGAARMIDASHMLYQSVMAAATDCSR